MPEGVPLSHRTRRDRHLLAMSPDPKDGCVKSTFAPR